MLRPCKNCKVWHDDNVPCRPENAASESPSVTGYVARRREQRTTSYCIQTYGCDHDTVRKGYVRCEVFKGACDYQTQDKAKAEKAT
jgi:hypothetical protein